MHRHALRIAATVSLAFVASGVFAHGDEEHSHDQAPPVVTPATAPLSIGDGPRRLADGSLYIPKPVQRRLAIRTLLARHGEMAMTVELNGKVIPDPDAAGRLQATQAGTLQPGPAGMPVLGRKVRRGEVLAWLRPAGNAIERGNQQAQAAELAAQLAIAESRVRRLEQLEGAVPQKDIESARIERRALQQRRALVSASVNAVEALIAPVSGVISASHVVAGQVVDSKDTLFEIVDPSRLYVEALAYDAVLATAVAGASALADGPTGPVALDLRFVGGGRQLREQALPLLFRINGHPPPLAVGQPVKVVVRTTATLKGAALPRQAVSRSVAGETSVWVHSEAERFVARRVRSQSLDADKVAITEGLRDGERVVSEGAGLLSQVR